MKDVKKTIKFLIVIGAVDFLIAFLIAPLFNLKLDFTFNWFLLFVITNFVVAWIFWYANNGKHRRKLFN